MWICLAMGSFPCLIVQAYTFMFPPHGHKLEANHPLLDTQNSWRRCLTVRDSQRAPWLPICRRPYVYVYIYIKLYIIYIIYYTLSYDINIMIYIHIYVYIYVCILWGK